MSQNDRKWLGSRDIDDIEHKRRAQYQKSLRRAVKAILAADAAMETVQAFASDGHAIMAHTTRWELNTIELRLRKLFEEVRQ